MHAVSQFLNHLLEQYGYVVLFFALLLEMLALPLPGELIMTYAGLIVFQGQMNWLLSIFVSWIGASLGMTIAYWIGYRLGNPFFEKYGARIHFGPDKLNSVSKWFDRYGNKMLIIAYFIPGVRHITGYFSGTTRISFRKYAIFAYLGAFLWVSLFITLGKLLGPQWEQYHHAINRYMLIFGLIAAAAYLLFYVFRKNRQLIYSRTLMLLDKGLEHYHSVGKVKFIVLAASALFVAFFTVMVGLIHHFLTYEFNDFDLFSAYLITRIFDTSWLDSMHRLARLGSYSVLSPLILLTWIWISWKGKDRLLEMVFYLVVLIGGEALDESLRRIFHRIGPMGKELTFPSEQALIALTFYGFTAYLLVRHHSNLQSRILSVILVVLFSLMAGISMVYLNEAYASDVVAGYIFGGVWLSLNVALLEIFRVMKVKRQVARRKMLLRRTKPS